MSPFVRTLALICLYPSSGPTRLTPIGVLHHGLPVTQAALSGAGVQFLLGEGDLLAEFAVAELACGADEARLELLPRVPAAYEKLRIVVELASGQMRETEVTDLFGNVTRIRFENIRVNTEPGPEVFRFEPPEGVDVIELELSPG